MNKRVYLERPEKSAIRALPPFEGLAKEQIVLLRSVSQVRAAEKELATARYVGFDTESKPVFLPKQPVVGPHLIQIASDRRTYLCQVSFKPGLTLFRNVLTSEKITKVGFGLKSDRDPLQKTLQTTLRQGIELSMLVKKLGYKEQVGLQMAVAVVLGRYLQKSKRVTTSNWADPNLSEAQLFYAANDAYTSLRIYQALLEREQLTPGTVQ